MSLLHHPNLVRCYGGYANSTTDTYFLVMDLMKCDVFKALQKDSPWIIDSEIMVRIALQTAKGLEYLHQCNLIHRDLKSVNLLIDENYNVKVCDFGLSRMVAPKKQNMTGNVGTVSWIAPEVFEKQPYDMKADVYSFGIVLWELYTKQVPFDNISTFEIPVAVIRGDRPPIPKDCPKDYCKLMKECWNKKPSKRPTFSKVVKTLTKILKSYVPAEDREIRIIKNLFQRTKARSSDGLLLDESQSSSSGDDTLIKSSSTPGFDGNNFNAPKSLRTEKLRRRTQSTSTMDAKSTNRKSVERRKSPPPRVIR